MNLSPTQYIVIVSCITDYSRESRGQVVVNIAKLPISVMLGTIKGLVSRKKILQFSDKVFINLYQRDKKVSNKEKATNM